MAEKSSKTNIVQGYELLHKISEGKHGVIKVAMDRTQSVERKVACKIINKQKVSEDFIKYFLPRELDVIQSIEHENIVHVYRVIDTDSDVYIFMELFERGDLDVFIFMSGKLSESTAKMYFGQLLAAIDYLHSHSICHRDIKCANILLSQGNSIKLTDFGFARRFKDDAGNTVLARTYCGTRPYLAPEILMRDYYDPKISDLWAVGCVLFKMLTGRMPFEENHPKRLLELQLDKHINFQELDKSSVAGKVIERLLEPDVQLRATIEQLKDDDWLKINPDTLDESHKS